MSALAELQAGAVADEFIALLERTIRAVGVARNFPPPDGFGQWDADAVHATASEFLSDGQTPRRLTDLALHCANPSGGGKLRETPTALIVRSRSAMNWSPTAPACSSARALIVVPLRGTGNRCPLISGQSSVSIGSRRLTDRKQSVHV